MDEASRIRTSKLLSFVLRHRPDTIGIELDSSGWVRVDVLLAACRAHGHALTRGDIEDVVATNPKRRFALTPDGTRIRANQGHSIAVELGYPPSAPPAVLFHGTVASKLDAIRAGGLAPMSRQHVHLSPDADAAKVMGARRGRPVVLRIAAGRMQRDGFAFYLATNGVWLTDRVPPEYIEFA